MLDKRTHTLESQRIKKKKYMAQMQSYFLLCVMCDKQFSHLIGQFQFPEFTWENFTKYIRIFQVTKHSLTVSGHRKQKNYKSKKNASYKSFHVCECINCRHCSFNYLKEKCDGMENDYTEQCCQWKIYCLRWWASSIDKIIPNIYKWTGIKTL